MPQFFKQHLLSSQPQLPEELELESPEVIDERHHYTQANVGSDKPYEDSTHLLFERDELSPVEDLLSWQAPSRPYRKKDRSFFTTAIVLVVLISLLAFLIDTPLLAVALVALLFVAFVLNYVPPQDINYKISAQGVTIGNRFYHWRDLNSFWVGHQDGSDMLYIRTKYQFPPVLIVLLGPIPTDKAIRACAHFIPYQEIPPRSVFDSWTKNLQKHFPLETLRN